MINYGVVDVKPVNTDTVGIPHLTTHNQIWRVSYRCKQDSASFHGRPGTVSSCCTESMHMVAIFT
jgi:hypothetical protein